MRPKDLPKAQCDIYVIDVLCTIWLRKLHIIHGHFPVLEAARRDGVKGILRRSEYADLLGS
jgi:hypothetical protein